jgi:hypothetical protein
MDGDTGMSTSGLGSIQSGDASHPRDGHRSERWGSWPPDARGGRCLRPAARASRTAARAPQHGANRHDRNSASVAGSAKCLQPSTCAVLTRPQRVVADAGREPASESGTNAIGRSDALAGGAGRPFTATRGSSSRECGNERSCRARWCGVRWGFVRRKAGAGSSGCGRVCFVVESSARSGDVDRRVAAA